MKLLWTNCAWVLGPILSIGACGGKTLLEGSGGSTAIPEPATVADFFAALADVWCSNVGKCCSHLGLGYNSAECAAEFAKQRADYQDLIRNKAVTYSAAAAPACI